VGLNLETIIQREGVGMVAGGPGDGGCCRLFGFGGERKGVDTGFPPGLMSDEVSSLLVFPALDSMSCVVRRARGRSVGDGWL